MPTFINKAKEANAAQQAAKPSSLGKSSWMKRGKEAAATVAAEDERSAQAGNSVFHFWLKNVFCR